MRYSRCKLIDMLITLSVHLAKRPISINPLKLKVMNIFSALRVYAGKWSEKAVRAFSQEEQDAIERAEVVDSQYGQSVCFFMVSGGQTYIPLDQNSSKATGDSVDLGSAKLVTLSKQGEADIYRVRC
jgi:hypothetical protein